MTDEYVEFIGELPTGAISDTIIASGTIQEVLNTLSTNLICARHIIYWEDDSTNAKCIYCRRA